MGCSGSKNTKVVTPTPHRITVTPAQRSSSGKQSPPSSASPSDVTRRGDDVKDRDVTATGGKVGKSCSPDSGAVVDVDGKSESGTALSQPTPAPSQQRQDSAHSEDTRSKTPSSTLEAQRDTSSPSQAPEASSPPDDPPGGQTEEVELPSSSQAQQGEDQTTAEPDLSEKELHTENTVPASPQENEESPQEVSDHPPRSPIEEAERPSSPQAEQGEDQTTAEPDPSDKEYQPEDTVPDSSQETEESPQEVSNETKDPDVTQTTPADESGSPETERPEDVPVPPPAGLQGQEDPEQPNQSTADTSEDPPVVLDLNEQQDESVSVSGEETEAKMAQTESLPCSDLENRETSSLQNQDEAEPATEPVSQTVSFDDAPDDVIVPEHPEVSSAQEADAVDERAGHVESPAPAPPPPVAPPTKRADEVVGGRTQLGDVDRFARKVDRPADDTVGALAKSLTLPYGDDLLKVRAVFVWLAHNITHDTDPSTVQLQDAASVLATGCAVADGFSALFHALCEAAGLHSLIVRGVAKGFGHDPEQEYTAESKANHSWNLVVVDGEWRPLDCAWGAGHVKDGQFVAKFKDYWFLTDPDEFVLRHFPVMDGIPSESEAYQLLQQPLTIDQFSARIRPESIAHAIGLSYVTHDHTVIDVSGDVTIKIKATRIPLTSVGAVLSERGVEEEKAEENNTCHVLTSLSDDNTGIIYVRPPRAATYLLEVRGQTKGQDRTSLYQLVTYVIRCQEPCASVEPFPEKTGVWGLQEPTATQCGLLKVKAESSTSDPRESFTFKATEGELVVPVPLTTFTKLKSQLFHSSSKDKDLAIFTFTQNTQDGASIAARLPKPGYYMLRVFAGHPEQSGLHHVADYLLHTDQENGTLQPFPRAFPFVNQECVRLLQPLIRQVAAGKSILFRVHGASLGKVFVGRENKMSKGDDDVWVAEVTPSEEETDVTIFGAVEPEADSLNALYQFQVQKEEQVDENPN